MKGSLEGGPDKGAKLTPQDILPRVPQGPAIQHLADAASHLCTASSSGRLSNQGAF